MLVDLTPRELNNVIWALGSNLSFNLSMREEERSELRTLLQKLDKLSTNEVKNGTNDKTIG